MKNMTIEYGDKKDIEVCYSMDEDDPSTGYRGVGVVVDTVTYNGIDVTELLYNEHDIISEKIEKQLNDKDI